MGGREELRRLALAADELFSAFVRACRYHTSDGFSGEMIVSEDERPTVDALVVLADALIGLEGLDLAAWPFRARLAVQTIADEARALAGRCGWGPALDRPEARDAWRNECLDAWHVAYRRPMLELAIAKQEAAESVLELPEWLDDLAEEGRRLGYAAARVDDLEAAWVEARRAMARASIFGSRDWRDGPGDEGLSRIHRAADVLRAVASHRPEPPAGAPAADPAAPRPEPPAVAVPPDEANPFPKLSPPGKAIGAAYDLKREGRPVTIKAAAQRAGVDRSQLYKNYPEVIQAIKQIGTPDGRVPRGSKDRLTGTIEAVDDDED